MKRSVVVVGVVATLAAGGFSTQKPEARTVTGAQAGLTETELKGRVAKLEERTQRLEERIARQETNTKRLESALEKSEAAVAALSKHVKTIAEAQERLARTVSVEASGAVRITGNLRLDNNVFEDITITNCDVEGTSGTKRQCTCPTGLIAIGIELRPLALSAYPGPATYNTALVCARL
jgi:hypothetical protein